MSVSESPVSDAASRSGRPGAVGGVVSSVSGSVGLVLEVLPAASVSVPVTFHVPGLSVGRVHEVAEPTTNEQVSVVLPFVALIVAVSPAVPASENDGVVSFVMLSVGELPVSEAVVRSGLAAGVVGAVVSTVRLMAGLGADTLPAPSVMVDVTFHDPAVRVGRSHDCVPVPMVYVQVFVVAPLVALIVTVLPLLPPLPVNVGVVSLVMLSVSDEPVSDAAARSGAVLGADGGVEMVRGSEEEALEVLPAGSVSVPVTVQEPGVSVGRSQEVADPMV